LSPIKTIKVRKSQTLNELFSWLVREILAPNQNAFDNQMSYTFLHLFDSNEVCHDPARAGTSRDIVSSFLSNYTIQQGSIYA